MDWRTVGSWAIKWQLLNQVATHAIAYHASDGKANENILRFGPNYLVSTIHAIRASIRGLEHLWTLIRCPDKEKMWLNEEKKEKELVTEGYREGIRVMHTNYAFLGYLLQDLVHVLMQYPELGGIDVIIHHVLFAATSVIAGTYKVFVFPFAWLILGEMSTPLLNLRWFLTETGKSDTKLYQGATYSFAIVFTLSRIVGWGLGVANLPRLLPYANTRIPKVFKYYVVSLILSGYFLNLSWFKKILHIALNKET